ncbi:hypothetical protein ACVFI8_04420 [Agarivorans sp. MS3-6]|uniref:hypothetical protein n=1 Tax=Agarivorans sp. TSD2052 TaxID=2937286 RepID=UPI00200DE621|nr:hypothetical protein [Agarivorans sp. TSD2052]UPW19741.1 hypothetical protein M0C34_05520 [Agarivorans sp. TSD2052]
MEQLIQMLYPFSWIVSILSFSPQIIRLMRTKGPAKDISFLSWIMFQCNAILAWSYTVFIVGDPLLSVTTSLVLIANLTMVSVLIYKRMKYREAPCSDALSA